MRTRHRIGSALIAIAFLGALVAAAGDDLLQTLRRGEIEDVRISLAPAGAQLGFDSEFTGDDPRLEPLLGLLRRAKPCRGHKCPNAGAIRFVMRDGRVIGVGLLPSHTAGSYNLRLYDGDRLTGVCCVERSELLAALEPLGVPRDDPAFRE
jgi:hypothetical protein